MEELDPRSGKGMKYFYIGLLLGALVSAGCVFLLTLFLFGGNNGLSSNINIGNNATGDTFGASEIDKLSIIEEAIDSYYYHDDYTREQLVDGAYQGMIESLGDIYADYYTVEEFQEIMQSNEGIFYGIGVVVSKNLDNGLLEISRVVKDSPAEAAGVRAGDYIYKVDGVDAYNLALEEAVELIQGEEGTNVEVTFLRGNEEIVREITRKKLETITVYYDMLEDQIAHIQITNFDAVTTDQFTEALMQAKTDGMQGLILDVRSNPGGQLDVVLDICRQILPEGLIVYTEDKYGNTDEYTCNGKNELDIPLVVLIDGYSASASEILAGAIKDYEKGILIGITTYGKGIVQQIFTLIDGTALKLTVSTYFTPNGTNIHGVGIDPDIEVIFDSEAYYSEENIDNQLERAIEYLKTGK